MKMSQHWAVLENISLYSDLDDYDEEEDKVVLMTLHSAKGLEFPVVYARYGRWTFQTINRLKMTEGGRRAQALLCGHYKGKEAAFLLAMQKAECYMVKPCCKPSRFIKEIPMHLCRFKQNTANKPQANQYYQPQNYEKAYGFNAINLNKSNNKDMNYKVGERVKHKKFGVGVILDVQSVGSDQRLEIALMKLEQKT